MSNAPGYTREKISVNQDILIDPIHNLLEDICKLHICYQLRGIIHGGSPCSSINKLNLNF